jgi:hypothetical protein
VAEATCSSPDGPPTIGDVKAVQRTLGHASAAIIVDLCADLFDDDLDD